MCRAGGSGDEEAVFAGAVRACGDRHRGRLRRSVRAHYDGDIQVFVDDGRSRSGAALPHAVEIRVVELASEIVASTAAADGEIFAAENRGGVCEGIGSETRGYVG